MYINYVYGIHVVVLVLYQITQFATLRQNDSDFYLCVLALYGVWRDKNLCDLRLIRINKPHAEICHFTVSHIELAASCTEL